MCVTPCVCLLQPVNSWLSSTWVCRLKPTHMLCHVHTMHTDSCYALSITTKWKLLNCSHFCCTLAPTILPLVKLHRVLLPLIVIVGISYVVPITKATEISQGINHDTKRIELLVDLALQWLWLLHATEMVTELHLSIPYVCLSAFWNLLMTQRTFHYLQKSGFMNIMLFSTSIHVCICICMCVCIHVSVWGSLRLAPMIHIVAFSHLLQYN